MVVGLSLATFPVLHAGAAFAPASTGETQPRIFHVKNFGARGDGKTLDTSALQAALDAASVAGGGTVDFAPGIYVTGSLFLHGHTHLVIGKGVTLLGVQDRSAYPKVFTRVAGIEMMYPAALLNIDGQEGVSITGQGVIDGNGKMWWDDFWSRVPSYEQRGLRWAVDYDAMRPELIRVFKARDVQIGGGLLLKRSPFWTVHLCYSINVQVRDLTIRDNDPVDGKGPSTDGVDIDSSSHIRVENVDIANNDDGIVLKAGMNADGQRVNRPTEDVTIRNSIIREGISGIAIGSDTAGGFRHIRISGITVLDKVRYGIYLKSTHLRGGFTEDVTFSDFDIRGAKVAIKVDLNYFPAFSTPVIPPGIDHNLPPGLKSVPGYWHVIATPVAPGRGTPHFRDLTFRNISGYSSAAAIEVDAAPDAPIENVFLERVTLRGKTAGFVKHIKNWRLSDVSISGDRGARVSVEEPNEALL
jgi:polygalacturonase